MKETVVINISGNFVIYSSPLPLLVSDPSHYLTAGLFYLLAHMSVDPRHASVFLYYTFCADIY